MHDDGFQHGRGFDPRQLPEFAPAPGLWPRVVAARQRQLHVRRWRHSGFAAAAAVVAGVAVWMMAPRPQPPLQPQLAGQHESQVLESEWQQLARSGRPAAASLARVRVIDAALQAAYDRDAPSEELTPLWQRRNQVLRGLIAQLQDADPGAPGVTRI